MTLAYHPLVEDDLAEAAGFYEARAPGLGEAFLQEARRAVDGICAMPERWARVEGPVRRCLLTRFPFALFYVYDGERVLVLSIVHTRRHPDTWKQRLSPSTSLP
jgi:toxin ParE1/3/4